MKKGFLIAMALVLVFSAAVFAEGETTTPAAKTYDNLFVTNIWPWIGMFYNIAYERMIGSSVSVKVGGWYQGASGDYGQFFDLCGSIFFHPLGKGINGWYIGPKYDAWVATGSGGTGMMHWLGGMGGYTIVLEGGFTLGIGLGVQVNIANTVTGGTITGTLPGTLPNVDLNMGFAF